jgi:Flp pilus assembly pilin Flp
MRDESDANPIEDFLVAVGIVALVFATTMLLVACIQHLRWVQ